MARLTNGFLHLAQADMDAAKMLLESIRIDELLFECEAQLKRANPNYVVRIDFDLNAIQNDTCFDILCNRSLIQTAFYNVIENACKYSTNQAVDVVISSVSSNIIVQFIDKGIGIRQEDFEHIFEPFYRSKETSGVHGFGIGLPLTKRIIDMHNGKIDISSKPNEGTHVRIEFAAWRS